MMVSSVTAMLDFGIEAVWRAVLDVENYPRWRSDLRRVEKIDAAHFVEYDRRRHGDSLCGDARGGACALGI